MRNLPDRPKFLEYETFLSWPCPMTLLVQPRLVNEAFSDAGLLLDFRFGGRAILFDLGDLSALSPREILRISHVFVSHMHMDHFIGFDHLLRLCLYRDKQLNIIGPPGIGDAIDAKLKAYTWNLLDEQSRDFSILASDWSDDGYVARSLFRAREAFARQTLSAGGKGLPLDEPEFHAEAVTLDHGIPCLAFAFQESIRINVHKARLDEIGLPVGSWLTEAKRAARNGEDEAIEFMPLAGVNAACQMHLSPRYLGREDELREEFAQSFAGAAAELQETAGEESPTRRKTPSPRPPSA